MLKVIHQAKIQELYYHGRRKKRDLGEFMSCAKNIYQRMVSPFSGIISAFEVHVVG